MSSFTNMAAEAAQQLIKRGKNGNNTDNTNLPNGAIIVLVLVGAGFLVLCGWAVTRHFYADIGGPASNHLADGFSQAQYMRDVRLRNQEIIEAEAGHYGGGPKRPVMRERETQMSMQRKLDVLEDSALLTKLDKRRYM
ncbi:hypothetical protein K431DRAFT_66313 [Polychaeton citri CBS 116435]|uniref:Uncharacterized protein n=1 Tax=Polychaeton citri CBS 116435 TaxID=1314669 RepID=A0A9P4UR43_9PEZI|nr:hypothetical protein K431DRAFT_66313 [Polychaeton citri CBS 116435]